MKESLKKIYSIDAFQATILILNLLVPLIIIVVSIIEKYFSPEFVIISFIPFIVSYVFLKIRVNFNKNKLVQIITDFIILLLIIPFFFFHILLVFALTISFIIDEYPTMDISKYNKLMGDEIYFPKKIPNNAKDVKMYYNTGILQAGTYKILYYKTESKELDYYIDKYEEYEKDIDQEALSTLGNRTYNGTPYESGLGEDFVKYQIEASCIDNCNHGVDKHYAINYETNEIIFFSESW